MSLFIAQLITVWLFIGRHECYVIDCLENDDCLISCDGIQSCMNSYMNCPQNGNCDIHCHGQRACQDAIINATLSSGDLNIICDASIDDCRRMKVYGSELKANHGHLNVTCNGAYQSCMQSEIYCNHATDCHMHCNGDSSCKLSKIIGPHHGHFNINCDGSASCLEAVVDGTHSLEMDITGCIASQSCFDLSLYCPPSPDDSVYCFLEGNDNLGGNIAGGRGINIYAMNGWKDIVVEYNGTFSKHHNGNMFCGFAYGISCDIAPNNWRCVNVDDYCNNNVEIEIDEIHHIEPHPTQKPSIVPSKHIYNSTKSTSSFDDSILQNTKEYVIVIKRVYTRFSDGPITMLAFGGGCIAFAVCCVICGALRKSRIWKRNRDREGNKAVTKKCVSCDSRTDHIDNYIVSDKWSDTDHECKSNVHSSISVHLKPDGYDVYEY